MTHLHTAPLAPMQIALAAFRQQYPTFDATRSLDTLRATEYARLDAQQQVYLDYTGGGPYAECQLQEHLELLSRHVFGNPHSTNPASQAMTDLVEQARRYILTYFHASPDEYVVIFTPNASGALKLVGESYPFTPSGHYLLTFDNHNSVLIGSKGRSAFRLGWRRISPMSTIFCSLSRAMFGKECSGEVSHIYIDEPVVVMGYNSRTIVLLIKFTEGQTNA